MRCWHRWCGGGDGGGRSRGCGGRGRGGQCELGQRRTLDVLMPMGRMLLRMCMRCAGGRELRDAG